MLKGKNLIVLFALMLLLGWLVASSISSFEPLIPGSNGTGSGSGGGGGGSSGSGSGTGSGGLGGSGGSGGGGFGFPFNFNFTGNFHLPTLNLSLPHFNFSLPSLNLSIFKFPFKLGFFNFSNLSGGGGGGGNGTSNGTGTPGGGSPGQTSPSPPNRIIPFNINPLILVILVAAVAAVLSIMVIRQVISQKTDKEPKEDELEMPLEPEATEGAQVQELMIDPLSIGPHEKTVPFSGWDPGNGLLGFKIDPALPLIWEKSSPLEFQLAKGAKLKEPSTGKPDSDGMYSYKPIETCTLFNAKTKTLEDRLWLRSVSYQDEVRRLFLLNMNLVGAKFTSMTPREVMRSLLNTTNKVDHLKDLEQIVNTFERSYYGKKTPLRSEFETFLYSLRGALADAKIVICADD